MRGERELVFLHFICFLYQAELFQAALLKLEEAAAMFEEAARQGSIPDSVKTSSSLLLQRLSTCLSSRQ